MASVHDRTLRQRLTRRRLLGGAAATGLGAAGLALVGCDGDDGGGLATPETPEADETPTLGGILKQRQEQSFPSLSPFGPTGLYPSGVSGILAYDHLWYVPLDTGEVVPFLAQDDGIEMADPEGLETVVTIKEAFYHDKPPVDGREVRATDIPPSWEAFRDDPFGLGRQWLREIMESVTASDDRTLVIKQKRPFAWMFGPTAAGDPTSSSILPVETLDEELFDLSQDVIGSGRFFLESHRGGENLKFRAHPNWRIPGEPFLGGVDYILITDFASSEAQFRAGNLDTVEFQNKLQADRMKDELGDEIVPTQELGLPYASLMLKMMPPFDDPRVREAIHLAVDRQELIQGVTLDPEGGVPAGIVPPGQELYTLSQDELAEDYFRHDPDAARALLEEAEFPFDQEFPLLFGSPDEEESNRAQILKEQLGRIGINIKLDPQDLLSVWIPRVLVQGDFVITTFPHLSYEDPFLPLALYTDSSPIGALDPDRGRNAMGFFDPEITQAADDAARELDFEARAEKVKAAQRLIIEKRAPLINLYSKVDFGARYRWVKGVVTGRGTYGLFNGQVWIDESLRG